MKVSVLELEEPELEPEPLEDPEPVPLLTEPPGRVKLEPFVENTTCPVVSVRYTEMPAEERLFNAVEVGWP